MGKAIKCPLCEKGYLIGVELADDEELDLKKPLKEHKYVAICDCCHRKVKYSIKKVEKESK